MLPPGSSSGPVAHGAPGTGARPPHGPASPPIDLDAVLWRSQPGLLVVAASVLLVILLAAGALFDLPYALDWLRRVAWVSWLVGIGWLAVSSFLRQRQILLWRVRRKLLLSYVFFGVVPVALVVAFSLAASVLLYVTVTKYVFLESYLDYVRIVRDIADASAVETRRTPALSASALERRFDNLRDRYPALSLALVPTDDAGGGAALAAGAWAHGPVPSSVPAWVRQAGGFAGTVIVPRGSDGAPQLVIRAAVATADGRQFAVADLPVDDRFTEALRGETGVAMGAFVVSGCGEGTPAAAAAIGPQRWAMFRETDAFLVCRSWPGGEDGRAAVELVAPVRELYGSLAALNLTSGMTSSNDWAVGVALLLWLLGGLFLVIQASAIVMGVLLAKSITSAVHELFEGTERVRQGDFAHRIRIDSKDQLGDLAGSFNRMSASIEHLLHVQREKQRLDDELRIAREIQKSLLPVHPPVVAGLDIAALCEPAREVGGDYYDFFVLGPRQLGVMVADVSGKGTSAALYMAELKGMMLALNRGGRTPRDLLIEANRLLAAHLDNRSFITMTYVFIDLDARRAALVRAGHTPMVRVTGGKADILAPDGIALGLRVPQAEAVFARVLEQQDVPLTDGDVLVLYTDGVTEATNQQGDLFGHDALAHLVARHHDLGSAGIRERVVRDVAAFAARGEAHDDMTMVIVTVTDTGAP